LRDSATGQAHWLSANNVHWDDALQPDPESTWIFAEAIRSKGCILDMGIASSSEKVNGLLGS